MTRQKNPDCLDARPYRTPAVDGIRLGGSELDLQVCRDGISSSDDILDSIERYVDDHVGNASLLLIGESYADTSLERSLAAVATRLPDSLLSAPSAALC